MGGCCKKTHMHPQTQHSGTHSEIVGEPASVGGQGADTQIQPKILVVMGKIGTQGKNLSNTRSQLHLKRAHLTR